MKGKANSWARKLAEFKQRRRRNVAVNAVCGVLLAAGLLWLGHFFWRHAAYEITNDAIVDQYIVPINVRVSGYIGEVNFKEHQRVQKGAVLLRIDDREFRVRVEDARAALLAAEGALEVLKADIEAAGAHIWAAQSNIEETAVQLAQLKADAERHEKLLREKAVSLQAYEQALSAFKGGAAKLESLRRQKDALAAQHRSLTHKIKGAEALISRRKADLELANLELGYTQITAPYDGCVGRRSVEPGEFVCAGQSVAHFVDDEQKWITANYKETQVARLHVGQRVKIFVDAFPGMELRGQVSAISAATGSKYSLLPIDNSAGNFVKVRQRVPVRIEFVDTTSETLALLRAGMTAETAAVK